MAAEPESPWVGRSHRELASLVRELLLSGHLIDRSGMPHLISRLGRQAMLEVAIDEWMAASPVYTPRIQRLLAFEGDSVEVIFKGMQFDIGAPPEFMDFRYRVDDHDHGGFHLDHCGALMDVEPMGDDYVVGMCHHIEDPTFDATAAATNPRARMRPIHRPPRTPADRQPHCEWTVTIEPDAEPLPIPLGAEALARSGLGRRPLATPTPGLPDDDGRADYSGPLDPDLKLEQFSSAVLSALADEIALQHHLLARAFLVSVADRVSGEDAVTIGGAQAAGIAGVTAKRLARALGVGPDLAGVAAVLAVHPLLLPVALVPRRIERHTEHITLTVDTGPGTTEPDGLTWSALLVGPAGDEILDALVVCVAPQSAATRVASDHTSATWTIAVDPDAESRSEPQSVLLTEFSTGAAFEFSP